MLKDLKVGDIILNKYTDEVMEITDIRCFLHSHEWVSFFGKCTPQGPKKEYYLPLSQVQVIKRKDNELDSLDFFRSKMT